MSALARIKKTAAQHEQDRQYDKALALYARLLEGAEAGEEDVDVALYNRAGDLALRVGDTARAIGYFERALDLYATGGLLNNAVALGVKILRHAPNHLSAHYTLGVLYGRKGFVGDSRTHLLTYAVQMQRAGRVDETGRVLAEVAATCRDAAERRIAHDAWGAMGGDSAYAAVLAGDAARPLDVPAPAAPATEDAVLTLSAPADALGIDDAGPEVGSVDLTFVDLGELGSGTGAELAPVGAQAAGADLLGSFSVAELALHDADAFDHESLHAPALGVAAAHGQDAPASTADTALVFLDVPDTEPVAAGGWAHDALALEEPAVAAPRWAGALQDEPPPLRLAELADVRDASAPALAPALPDLGDLEVRPVDLAWAEPAAPRTPADALDGVVPALDAPLASPAAAAMTDLAVPMTPVVESSGLVGADDGLDLGAWLREVVPAESTRMTTFDVPQSGDEQADFDATLRTFTEGVTRAVDRDDFDSHYDLGVAFREMGLLDEAIVQFQRAAQAPGRPLRAIEALAQSFLDAGQPELAFSTLEGPVEAAERAGAGDASLVAVHYLMGAAAQALGRSHDARRWLVRVVATDVRFRDASSRLAALPSPNSA
jgi:tetratricopeptide (TPR) repeat protein